jgi:hypothetical protein
LALWRALHRSGRTPVVPSSRRRDSDLGVLDQLNWQCSTCGDEGSISNFAGGPHDFSRFITDGKTPVWGFDEREREVLLDVTARRADLRAVVARGREESGTDQLIVDVSDPELDAMFAFLEELAENTRSAERSELLEGLMFTLPTAVDPFEHF